jgi:hypothetical protein
VRKIVTIAGGVLGGAAMLGIGMAVGSQVNQNDALIAAANVESPVTAQDKLLLGTFTQASSNFDALVKRAQQGKQVGPEMTRQAVAVMNVKRLAAGDTLRATAETTADAMLLIGAGVTANDEETVREGIAEYEKAQESVVQLAQEINPDAVNEGESQQGDPAGEQADSEE